MRAVAIHGCRRFLPQCRPSCLFFAPNRSKLMPETFCLSRLAFSWPAVLLCVGFVASGCNPATPQLTQQAGSPPSSAPAASATPATSPPAEQSSTAVGEPSKATATTKEEHLTEQSRLVVDSPRPDDWFGTAVAIAGNYALVGSGGDDEQGEDFGAAYFFERQDGNAWKRVAKLHGDDIQRHVRFGYAVALSETIAVVGAERAAAFSGAVYVFERREQGVWKQTAHLNASDHHESQLFGARVALSGRRLIVGAQQDNGKGGSAGAAYLFEREDDGSWREVAKLTGSDTAKSDQFGAAVALSGDVAVVGSRHNENNTGTAYVFERKDDTWLQTARLKAREPIAFGQFGISVGVADRTILVGEWRSKLKGEQTGAVHTFRRDASGTWQPADLLVANDATAGDAFGYAIAMHGDKAVIGTLPNTAGARNASAYVFQAVPPDGDWQQIAKLTPSDSKADDHFGSAVAIDGNTVLIGAEQAANKAGAAYVFQVDADTRSPN